MHIDGLKAEIQKALREMGVCNVLIAGRTGVGKSTLLVIAMVQCWWVV